MKKCWVAVWERSSSYDTRGIQYFMGLACSSILVEVP